MKNLEKISCLTYDRSKEEIISGTYLGNIKIWCAQSGTLLRVFQAHKDKINSIAYDSNSNNCASGSWDQKVCIWSTEEGNLIRELSGHEINVTSVAYSPDGEQLISGSYDETVKVWSTTFWELISSLQQGEFVNSVAYRPDGLQFAAGGYSKILVWSTSHRTLLYKLDSDGPVYSICYSPNATFLVSAENDILNIRTGFGIVRSIQHRAEIKDHAYAPNGKEIASVSDGIVSVWSQSGKLLEVFGGKKLSTERVIYISDGKKLAIVEEGEIFLCHRRSMLQRASHLTYSALTSLTRWLNEQKRNFTFKTRHLLYQLRVALSSFNQLLIRMRIFYLFYGLPLALGAALLYRNYQLEVKRAKRVALEEESKKQIYRKAISFCKSLMMNIYSSSKNLLLSLLGE